MGLPINQIICGDNCDVLGTFPRDCIDLVVTSPPYDDLRTYGGHDWDFYGVAWQLKRVLKPGGVIVWVVADQTKEGDESGSSWAQAQHFRDIGLRLHDTMIYEVNGTGAKGSNLAYWQTWEYTFVLVKGKLETFNPLSNGKKVASGGNRKLANGETKTGNCRDTEKDGRRSNIWRYNAGNNSGGDQIGDHPAPFPERLASDHILSWSNEGDIVLDPFSGSGTTAKMAKHNGRKYIGIEVNAEYCEIAEKRLAQGVFDFAT